VTSLRESVPFDLRNELEERFDADVLRFVKPTIEDESGYLNAMKIRNDGPRFEGPNDEKLGWPVPFKSLASAMSGDGW
jgi:hypothetical protein